MNLIYLPKELLESISNHLPRNYLANLCLTCKLGYQLFLPILYKHIILSHRTQIKQLEQGLLNNYYLRQAANEYTQVVTLKCRQGGNEHYWKSIFIHLPNTRQLYFRDYISLSVTKIHHILSFVPKVNLLDIQYCDLITNTGSTIEIFNNITELNLLWTDFSLDAIKQLFQSIPQLVTVNLGANHNRKPLENDLALQVMSEVCPNIERLSVSLQQVSENTLCRLLTVYGYQLTLLSIRCEGTQVIKRISQCAKRLQHLVIRHSGCNKNDITDILRECESLSHFAMVSWPIQEVPSVVLGRMRDQVEGIRKTFALDRNDLEEIRRLCLYQEQEI